ncbi:23S rRNA (adenine(2030)-N(6))-methyltransferase RlmJ [Beijerinckia sp. L45]|uniref:23S rRNA (adenine(2030)-N(6))-methyltransferase RlmJ n=1 Tax=Beijerinckia sp. L45 TaxID=1641855 RepID=UPI00131B0CB1|nr:23S rRNA (adenine(2030)-N(6))-methyltransferase RlmJ [Beijerinckia sp. L45]
MNYRHDFHAGNFADVFKHAILTRILVYLMRKPAPLRFVDTHAGSGRYDLTSAEAGRTNEWRSGIGGLDPASMSEEARDLLAPYLAIVGAAARGEGFYPGSPALALALLRPFDRMLFCDLHPAALEALKTCVGRDKRAKVIALDGYIGLNAFLPPIERRAVILIDPPFESENEFETLAASLVAAWRKWRDGVFVAWYPIKDRRGVELLASRLREAGMAALRLEFQVDAPQPDQRLSANGLIVINPPFALEAEAACLLPALVRQLAPDRGDFRIGWIEPQTPRT